MQPQHSCSFRGHERSRVRRGPGGSFSGYPLLTRSRNLLPLAPKVTPSTFEGLLPTNVSCRGSACLPGCRRSPHVAPPHSIHFVIAEAMEKSQQNARRSLNSPEQRKESASLPQALSLLGFSLRPGPHVVRKRRKTAIFLPQIGPCRLQRRVSCPMTRRLQSCLQRTRACGSQQTGYNPEKISPLCTLFCSGTRPIVPSRKGRKLSISAVHPPKSSFS